MLDQVSKPAYPDFHALVDLQAGLVDRSIFSDEEIYKLELERIFARGWNFMCHESQIPKPGDFFLSFIGDDSVIATRDKTGKLQVFLNTCRHRGNAVCRAEQGHTKSFLCTYHGWTYGLDGKLIGVPGYKDFYHEDLDRSQWGLVAAPHVESYKGFVFACMDPDAPNLNEFLGPVGRMCIDQIASRGKLAIVDGVSKNIIGCNWKLAVDNVFDYYHVITHMSAFMSGGTAPVIRGGPGGSEPQRTVLGEYGHAIGGPKLTEEDVDAMKASPNDAVAQSRDLYHRMLPEVQETLGDVGVYAQGHPHIFPNFWVSGNQVSLRIPRGPNKTEIWWFTFLDEDMPKETRDMRMHRAIHAFGAAGMLEQEDGENWDQSTRATRGVLAKRYPLNFRMGMGHDIVQKDEKSGISYIDTLVSEHPQRWTYRAWADWMTAESWADLKRDRAPIPEGIA
ncbi:aromatic ring-hydroxylating oxygenase subunit alpha [Sphingomonas vulcanisoli]|nr:aromatic ring-hydroxylating dioxygenase subunit alpha [Sphingomonas vulcanisoli]